MRRYLAALAFLASATLAQAGFLLNPFAVRVPPSISYVDTTVSTTDTNEYTFTDHATGTADGTRRTIVGIVGEDGSNDFSVTGVTVGGVAATEVVDTAAAGAAIQSAIYIIDNPTGTTATIVVTFSEAITGAAVSVWAANNLASSTAVATNSGTNSSGAAITLSLNTQVEDIIVGVGGANVSSEAAVWAGLTEDAETAITGEAEISVAHDTAATAETPRAITVDWSGTSQYAGASASFR